MDIEINKQLIIDFIEDLEKEIKVAISVKNSDFAEGAMFVFNKLKGDPSYYDEQRRLVKESQTTRKRKKDKRT